MREAGIPYRAIYKNTTIDPPGTIQHVREMGVEVIQPKKTFFEVIAYAGLPNRFKRTCCNFLKEYKVLNRSVMGVRRSESVRRAARYQEPTQCRYYGAARPENHVEVIYPILDWTDQDVADFIADRNIKCAPYYYDEDGKFHVERRLGCMCCPMMYWKRRVEQFREHPAMVKAYLRAAQKYLAEHPNSKTAGQYADAYEWFTRDVFYDKRKEEWEALTSPDNLFDKPDFKAFLEREFSIDLTL